MVKYLVSKSDIFASESVFLLDKLTFGILFATASRETVVAKRVMLGILPLISVILAL